MAARMGATQGGLEAVEAMLSEAQAKLAEAQKKAAKNIKLLGKLPQKRSAAQTAADGNRLKQIDDYERADKLVRCNGDVPYTIVRAAHLMDSPGTGAYKHSLKGFYHIAMKIPRADVASFLLRAAPVAAARRSCAGRRRPTRRSW